MVFIIKEGTACSLPSRAEGTTHQFSVEIKYLGDTLGEKLIRSKHVDVKMKREREREFAVGLLLRLRPHVVKFLSLDLCSLVQP